MMSAPPHPCLAAGGTGGHMFPAEALARRAAGARPSASSLVTDERGGGLRRPPAAGGGASHRAPAASPAAASCRAAAQRGRASALGAFQARGLLRQPQARRRGRLRRLSVGADRLAAAQRARRADGPARAERACSAAPTGCSPPRAGASAPRFDAGRSSPADAGGAAQRDRQPGPPGHLAPSRDLPYAAPRRRRRGALCSWSAAARAPASSARSCPKRVALLPPELRERLAHRAAVRAPRTSTRRRPPIAALGIDAELAAVLPRRAGAAAPARISLICRSGASTVAELAAAGRPAVLVPLPQRHRRPPDRQRPGRWPTPAAAG